MPASRPSNPRLSILGLGLLGGSAALAARRLPERWHLTGYDVNPAAPAAALESGTLDAAAPDVKTAVEGADLVLLAAPVGQIVQLLAEIAPHLPPGAVATDVGSTKQSIYAAGERALPGRFVGAHPMAGGERQGLGAARSDLFDGATCVLTPPPDAALTVIERVATFWRALGCTILNLTPADHDRRVAAASHLPHAAAAAVARAQTRESLEIAGRGYRDVTRIAAADPSLWADILLDNRAEVAPRLRAMAADLARLAEMLEAAGAAEGVREWLNVPMQAGV